MSRALRFVPIALLALLVAALVWRLANPGDSTIRSRMIGKLVPDLVLQPATPGKDGWRLRSASCGPVVINFFASWCAPCIAEARLLGDLKQQGVPIIGIAVRDRPQDVARFLDRHGDPFDATGADPDSRVQMAFGSSGVPETFIVDPYCKIRRQHIGPIEAADVATIRTHWESLRK